jgi:hypothetical protein
MNMTQKLHFATQNSPKHLVVCPDSRGSDKANRSPIARDANLYKHGRAFQLKLVYRLFSKPDCYANRLFAWASFDLLLIITLIQDKIYDLISCFENASPGKDLNLPLSRPVLDYI